MPDISRLSVLDWQELVAGSNRFAMTKRHKYPPCEERFLQNCCEFVPPACGPSCFCRKVGNCGVWTLRADIEFEQFLDSYANLWTPGWKDALRRYLDDPDAQPAGRLTNMAPVLREAKRLWGSWTNGHSLPQVINSVRRCYFCDDAFECIDPIVSRIQTFASDSTGIPTSKLISQLFYDIAVPFDNQAKTGQQSFGCDPYSYGAGVMRDRAKTWLLANGFSVDDFRTLDDAPRKYWPSSTNGNPVGPAPCSRVLDKLHYGQS